MSLAIEIEPHNPQLWVNRGTVHLKGRNYPAALLDAEQALSRAPDHYEAHALKIHTLANLGDRKQAIASCTAALEHPTCRRAEVLGIRADLRWLEKDEKGALGDYTALLELAPPEPRFYMARARVYRDLESFELALADVNAALKLNRKYVPGLELRGYLRYRLNRLDDARTDFDLILELDPKNVETLYKRAVLHSKQRRIAEGLADCARYLSLAPREHRLRSRVKELKARLERARRDPRRSELQRRVVTLVRAKKYREALRVQNELVRLYPRSASHLNERGSLLYALGDKRAALVDITRSLELMPGFKSSRVTRIRIYKELGEYEQAIADLEVLLARSEIQASERASVLSSRGVASYELKRYPRALKDFDDALALDPRYAKGYSCRGRLHVIKKRWKKAAADLKRALQLDPQDLENTLHLGVAVHHLGQNTRALELIQTFLRSYPDNADGLYWRAKIHARLEQWERAVADLERLLARHPRSHLVESVRVLLPRFKKRLPR